MPAQPLTRRDLDAAQCQVPGCTHTEHEAGPGLAIHGRCHPGAGTIAWYRAGVLTFRCKKCECIVVDIAVKDA
jgi:hypothetical protein